jgi:hypothetical protein
VFEALGLKSSHAHHHGHYYRRGYRGHDSRHKTLTGSGIEFLGSPLFPEATANFSLERDIPVIELDGAALAGKLIDPQFHHSHGYRHHKSHGGTPTDGFPVVSDMKQNSRVLNGTLVLILLLLLGWAGYSWLQPKFPATVKGDDIVPLPRELETPASRISYRAALGTTL